MGDEEEQMVTAMDVKMIETLNPGSSAIFRWYDVTNQKTNGMHKKWINLNKQGISFRRDKNFDARMTDQNGNGVVSPYGTYYDIAEIVCGTGSYMFIKVPEQSTNSTAYLPINNIDNSPLCRPDDPPSGVAEEYEVIASTGVAFRAGPHYDDKWVGPNAPPIATQGTKYRGHVIMGFSGEDKKRKQNVRFLRTDAGKLLPLATLDGVEVLKLNAAAKPAPPPPAAPYVAPTPAPAAPPAYTPPAAYVPPVQPAYVPPVQPAYVPPVQPAYVPPVQPVYVPPVQPAYVAPASPWQQFVADGGRPYWFNSSTGVTTWNDPFLAPVPAKPLWEAVIDPASGRKYWYNTQTKQTTWNDPLAQQPQYAPVQQPQYVPVQQPQYVPAYQPQYSGGQPQTKYVLVYGDGPPCTRNGRYEILGEFYDLEQARQNLNHCMGRPMTNNHSRFLCEIVNGQVAQRDPSNLGATLGLAAKQGNWDTRPDLWNARWHNMETIDTMNAFVLANMRR